jgi:murein DD-endopeptidase MepM/ murein hydrolase activator NlpD
MDGRPRRTAQAATGVVALLLASVAALVWGPSAPAQSVYDQIAQKQSEIADAHAKEGVLSTTIERYSNRIDRLQGDVATLRNREAKVEEELERVQAELKRDEKRLEELRAHLRRAIRILEERLVSIYKSDEPDVLTVVLQSDGFSDLLERYEYLSRIEDQDSAVVGRVRDLRNEMRETVERVKKNRDRIAAKERELERTRSTLEARQGALSAARAENEGVLEATRTHRHELEGDLSALSAQVTSQLAGLPSSPLPAGPIRQGGSGLIWPVNGPVTSPYGMRWGRLHAGIDISAPAGTPIRAAKAGQTAIASPYGGYGNFVCLNHGGGLSTCYAHQSSMATSVGASVSQGQVIGYVGCTGHCFGDHLHFEVRVNGSPQDPLAYL